MGGVGRSYCKQTFMKGMEGLRPPSCREWMTDCFNILFSFSTRVCSEYCLSCHGGAVSAQKKIISGPQRVTLNIPKCDFLLLSFLSASVQGSMPAAKMFLTPHPILSCFISVCGFFFVVVVQSHMQRGISSVLYHILFLEALSFRTLL